MSDTKKFSLRGAATDPTLIFAALLITVVLMLIIPIPAGVLDFLMSLSILSGILIVILVAYLKSATEFSIFPAVLLVTTVFRLAVNVSSTRLILSQGANFDGKMVRAFGSFVVGGGGDASSLVIGAIIFAILVIVQFLVITKGATRVSEVAARFSLDSMPNKYMAIDMDTQNGVITEQEAILRRKGVEEESAFYGNMDGASKFVQGDIIVGIIITFVNIIGGFIVGMVVRGEPFDLALNNYITLTIGDGLVSQIPSLLISFGTGLIVTRSMAKDSLGESIWKQITAQYKVFYIAAGALGVLAILPGFPNIILAVMAAGLAFGGYQLYTAELKKETKEEDAKVTKKQEEKKKGPEDVSSMLKVDPLALHIGYELIPLVDGGENAELLKSIAGIRRHMAGEFGIVVQPIRIQDNIRLNPDEYVFKIRGQDIAGSRVKPGYMMAMGDGLEPVEGEKTIEPAFGFEAYWIKESDREAAENLGYTVVDIPTVISTHIQEVLKLHSAELLDRESVNELIQKTREHYPIVVDDILNESKYTKVQIQKVLQNLLKENVSIKDLPFILETLSEYSSQTPIFELVEHVRQAMKRIVSSRYATEDSKLSILRINPAIEQEIYKNLTTEATGEPLLRLSPDTLSKIQNAIKAKVIEMYQQGLPPVIVTQPQIRRVVWEICQYINKNIAVLSTRELVPDLEVTLVGQIDLEYSEQSA